MLTQVLDRIIPDSGDMPGAGQAGVAKSLVLKLQKDQELNGLFNRGLENISVKTAAKGTEFAALPDGDKDEVLRAVEDADPEFFAVLIEQAYAGYYTDPSVLALLGEETRPPQPSGHKIKQGDLSLLKAVRARGPIYRTVE